MCEGMTGQLQDLFEETCDLCMSNSLEPCLAEIGFGNKWTVASLDDGRSGRAFNFTGEHAIYGPMDLAILDELTSYAGQPVSSLAAWVFEESKEFSTSILRQSVGLSVINALASWINAPEALSDRGYSIKPFTDRSFIRPEDRVVVVGAGMVIKEAAAICGHVDIIDMRPLCSLQTLRIGKTVERGPSGMVFHGIEDTDALFNQADVICITGSSLVNETFFELAKLPHHAHEFVLFGPSAQAPVSLLGTWGVTRIITSRVSDGKRLLESMLSGSDKKVSEPCTQSYTVIC